MNHVPKSKRRIALVAWRLENDLKQYEFAALLGVSSTYISMIETGRADPSPGVAREIRDLTGLDV